MGDAMDKDAASGNSASGQNAGKFQVEEATIADIRNAMKNGELSCRSLVEAYLARIDAYDQKGPALNSVILVNPNAAAIADELDKKLKTSGFVGPLHGIPVVLKDNVNTADMFTTGGSLSLKNSLPPDDAFLVKRLREAGALILAKVNLHEFAVAGVTTSSILGQTLNPYDLTRTPGGSSGGTGVAISANFASVGIGTDTMNSIRSPSSASSIVGMKPTMGLVSRDGIIPVALTQDMAGPMARTVADASRVLDVIAGYDPNDPVTAASVGYVTRYPAFLDAKGLKVARIGILQSFFGSAPEHEEVNAVCGQAIKEMENGGAILLPMREKIEAAELIEGVSVHHMELNSQLNHYLKSLGKSNRVKTIEDILASGNFHPSIEKVLRENEKPRSDDRNYKERLLRRVGVQLQVLKIMADYKLDAIVYPHQKRLVVPMGEYQADRNGVLGAVTGFPAITVPAGFSNPTKSAPIGVPIGIEFLGRPWSEALLIRLAYSFEQSTKFRRSPTIVPSFGPSS